MKANHTYYGLILGRRLVFFLKLWQKYIPGDEFSFNNYTLCLLATCFFQAKELIPSFVSVQDDSAPIGG